MFGIGFQELILIMIVALIVLGPKRLPEAARAIGKFFKEFKSVTEEVKSSISTDISQIVNEEKEDHRKQHQITSKSASKEEYKDQFEEEFEKELKKEEYQPKREKISFNKKVEPKEKTGEQLNAEHKS